MDQIKVASIIQQRDLAFIGVMAIPDCPDIGATVFEALGSSSINVHFVVQCIDLSGPGSGPRK